MVLIFFILVKATESRLSAITIKLKLLNLAMLSFSKTILSINPSGRGF